MTAKKKEILMIVDGNALVHRSFHALPLAMRTKDGETTNAVYGFAAALLKAFKELKPDYAVLTLDAKGPTFRHQRFKDYKAKRVKAPPELYEQIPRVKELAEAFDIPVFVLPGFEADDLIGTIAKKVDGGIEKIILTGDQDTMQLVNGHTKVFAITHGVADTALYDNSGVEKKLGVRPEQVVDYKALRGDPSDNIPGVKGVGEKTAVELLREFGDLDEIYEHARRDTKRLTQKFKPRIIALLKEYKADAYLSRELATIKCDVPISFDLEAARFSPRSHDRAAGFFRKMEFNSLLPRLKDLGESGSPLSREEKAEKIEDKFERNRQSFKYAMVDNDKCFALFLRELKKQPSFVFDTETSGLDPITADLLGISFSWKPGEAWYVKINSGQGITNGAGDDLFSYGKNHDQQLAKDGLHPFLKRLKPIFENEAVEKQAHNAKFDFRVLKNQGIEVKNIGFDTMIASYLLNPGSRQHNLDALVLGEFGFDKISKDDLLGKGKDRIGFNRVEDEKLMLYSCEDADYTGRLVSDFKEKLDAAGLKDLFSRLEMPLVTVLSRMEDRGIRLEPKRLDIMRSKVNRKINSLVRKIHEAAGEEFNIDSPKQLQAVLFDKMGIPADRMKKTKTGISTAASELDKLLDSHRIIRLIREYREYAKLSHTYIDALPKLINRRTGRIHTSYNQAVAATGRLSSTDPNLQNIPVRTALGREIRRAFTAEAGYVLAAFDYSQIELRLAAHYSEDPTMIRSFREKVDIHAAVAAEINRVSPDEVDDKMRREAKAINFGVLYGQGPHGLSQTADIPYARAQEFITSYFETFENIKAFIDNTIRQARQDGYVSTMMGRLRYLPELNSGVVAVRKAAERMAVNTPLQGTAADMLKKAMIEIDRAVVTEDIRLLLTVHDELIFEIKKSKVKSALPRIKNIMEDVIKLKVPVVVEIKTGGNWGEMAKEKAGA